MKYARDFLIEICDPGPQLTKKELRMRVRGILKHYPADFDVIIAPDHDAPKDIIEKWRELKRLLPDGAFDR
jgi:hypothetical protein